MKYSSEFLKSLHGCTCMRFQFSDQTFNELTAMLFNYGPANRSMEGSITKYIKSIFHEAKTTIIMERWGGWKQRANLESDIKGTICVCIEWQVILQNPTDQRHVHGKPRWRHVADPTNLRFSARITWQCTKSQKGKHSSNFTVKWH